MRLRKHPRCLRARGGGGHRPPSGDRAEGSEKPARVSPLSFSRRDSAREGRRDRLPLPADRASSRAAHGNAVRGLSGGSGDREGAPRELSGSDRQSRFAPGARSAVPRATRHSRRRVHPHLPGAFSSGLSSSSNADAGGFLLRLGESSEAQERFRNGIALAGDCLRSESEPSLSGREWEELSRGRVYRREEVGELVGQVLPSLKGRIPIEVRARELPGTVRERPRLSLRVERHGDTRDALYVLPGIVYGDPPRARVDGERLVALGGDVPLRDLEAERKLEESPHSRPGSVYAQGSRARSGGCRGARREARGARRWRRRTGARSVPAPRGAPSQADPRRVRLRAVLRDRRSPRGSRRRSAGLPRGPLCGSAPRLRIRDTSSRLARALRRGDRRSPSSARERGNAYQSLGLRPRSSRGRARGASASGLRGAPGPRRGLLGASEGTDSRAPPRTAPRLSEEGSRLAPFPQVGGSRSPPRGRHGSGKDDPGAIGPRGTEPRRRADERSPQLDGGGDALPSRSVSLSLPRPRSKARSRGRSHRDQSRAPAAGSRASDIDSVGHRRHRRRPGDPQPRHGSRPRGLRSLRPVPREPHGYPDRESARSTSGARSTF